MQVYIARRRYRCCELISACLIPVDRPDIGASSTIYRSGGISVKKYGKSDRIPTTLAPLHSGRVISYHLQYVYVLCLIKKHKSRTDFTRIFLGSILPQRACQTQPVPCNVFAKQIHTNSGRRFATRGRCDPCVRTNIDLLQG